MPHPKLDATLAYLTKQGFTNLSSGLKAFAKGQESTIESELALGQAHESKLEAAGIHIHRSFILVWMWNEKPVWDGCSTKAEILKKLNSYKDADLVQWLKNENQSAGPQASQVAVVPATPVHHQVLPQHRVPQHQHVQPASVHQHAPTRAQSPVRTPVSNVPNAGANARVGQPGGIAARAQQLQNALGANQAPVRVVQQPTPPSVPVQPTARRKSLMLPLGTPSSDGLAKDRKAAEMLLATQKMRAIVVMDAYNGSYDASEGAKKICDTFARQEKTGNYGKFLLSQVAIPKTKDEWLKLGANTKTWGMGNCQQCMALAFSELIATEGWSSAIELVHTGSGGIGHHFLIVGRPNRSEPLKTTKNWGGSFIVDLWLQNLNRPGDGSKAQLGKEIGEWSGGVKDCASDKFLIGNLSNAVVDCAWP